MRRPRRMLYGFSPAMPAAVSSVSAFALVMSGVLGLDMRKE